MHSPQRMHSSGFDPAGVALAVEFGQGGFIYSFEFHVGAGLFNAQKGHSVAQGKDYGLQVGGH